jgi:cytochrome P450
VELNLNVQDLGKKVQEIRGGINAGHKTALHPTIFHELLNSDLPESEKTNARLGDEAQLIVAAGLITTSWSLTVASYHISANPEISATLRAELRDAGVASEPSRRDWHQLEALPYLNGCVHEAVRLAHGVSTRSPRLAPDQQLRYGEWSIPKNTPVSMTNVDTLMNDWIFHDPKEFKPERWMEDSKDLERYFVPFSKGSRQCLGIK